MWTGQIAADLVPTIDTHLDRLQLIFTDGLRKGSDLWDSTTRHHHPFLSSHSNIIFSFTDFWHDQVHLDMKYLMIKSRSVILLFSFIIFFKMSVIYSQIFNFTFSSKIKYFSME